MGWGVSGGGGQSAQAQQVGFPHQRAQVPMPRFGRAQSSQTPALSCPRKALRSLGPWPGRKRVGTHRGQDVVWLLHRLEARVALTETGV